MTSESIKIQIDRSERKEVDKYIKNVFIYLKKYKTQDILNAYFTWYKSQPERMSLEVKEFDSIPRKNKEDFEKVNKKRTIDIAYGDKYAILLTKFVRANYSYETELIKIAQGLIVASKFEGRNNLGISNLLSSFDINLIKCVFKLLRNESGIVNVVAIPDKKPRVITKKNDNFNYNDEFDYNDDYSSSSFEPIDYKINDDHKDTCHKFSKFDSIFNPIKMNEFKELKGSVATPDSHTKLLNPSVSIEKEKRSIKKDSSIISDDEFTIKKELYLECVKKEINSSIEKSSSYLDIFFKNLGRNSAKPTKDTEDDVEIIKVIEHTKKDEFNDLNSLTDQIYSLDITSKKNKSLTNLK